MHDGFKGERDLLAVALLHAPLPHAGAPVLDDAPENNGPYHGGASPAVRGRFHHHLLQVQVRLPRQSGKAPVVAQLLERGLEFLGVHHLPGERKGARRTGKRGTRGGGTVCERPECER